MIELLAVLALLYAGVAAFAWFLSDRLIFQPPASTYSPESLPLAHVETEDGVRIAVLHLPNPEARYTILYSHGNAEDLGTILPGLERLRNAGFAVVAYDYRGYGTSEGGPPSSAGGYLDIRAAYRHTVERLAVPPSRLLVYGFSVGTGPSIDLAAREPVAGLVVENGFVSAFRVVTGAAILPFDRFPNLRTIARVRCPVLVMHGTRDRVIRSSHGRRLFEAAPEPKLSLWVDGAGHNDLPWVAGERYEEALGALVEVVEAAGG